MLRLTEIRLPIDHGESALRAAVLARLGVDDAALLAMHVFKRGHDARKRAAVVFVYTVDCELADEAAVLTAHAGDAHLRSAPDMCYRFVARAPADFAASGRPRPVIVGFGPCGIFAALVLAQMGFRPIVLERGRAVRERTRDTWALWRRGILDPESNVQFGEGGAGTFSDGKLWSQISDPRHLTRKVIDEFVKAGAPEEIAFVAKPHIGTFRLVGVVEKMRAEIERLGGEVRFSARVVDVIIERGAIRGVVVEHAGKPAEPEATALRSAGAARREAMAADRVVLALGHSARDTFAMLYERGVAMQAKAFSIGFRIEHPQSVIDSARFGPNAGHRLLGAADYKVVHHAKNGRSVYSFCMCPGGTVVAATSETGCVVTNGMSQYSRNERNANAGIVVGLTPDDYRISTGAKRASGSSVGPGDVVAPLDGIAFQRHWESRAFDLGGRTYAAPGQRVGDFLGGRPSLAFGRVMPSYTPAVLPTNLAEKGNESLPTYAIEAIRESLGAFARQIEGFAMDDAVLTGVETRTSSPLRMPRGQDWQSVNVAGLYPAGEGAGYAGGIMSAAVDGIQVAEAVALAIASPRA